MATATETRKRPGKSDPSTNGAPSAPSNGPESVSITPPATDNGAPSNGPTLQQALDQISAPESKPIVNGDANTVEFLEIVKEFGEIIRSQKRNQVGQMADRGNAARRAVNVKMLKGRSKDSRSQLRAAALTVLENEALASYDPTVEQKPKIDRWISLDVVCSAYPESRGLASVAACEKLATMWTRIDPPRAWDAPDEYELKRQYRGKDAEIARLIARAVREQWTETQVSEGIDVINGAVGPDPIKPKDESDPIKAARTLAIKIMESILATTVDAETLFDELQSQLTKYGWTLAKSHGPNGAETLRALKTGR